jgi:hypothetical protein
VVIPLVAAVVLVGSVVAVATQLNGQPTSTGSPTPTVGASVSTAANSTAAPSGSSSASPQSTPTASGTAASSAAGTKALESCRAKVQAADKVLAEAKIGITHWAAHVQAQTDANNDKISVGQMNGKFKETRLEGPADQSRYRKALAGYDDLKGSCKPVSGADSSVAASLGKCADRAAAQRPVLAAAADGMADWRSHLAAMQRSRMTHVPDAEGVWLRAWRAAPPHIRAYQKAVKNFDAPSC